MTVSTNLIVAGAARSGTSTLHQYLNAHPDIVMSEPKEPHYFSGHWPHTREDYEALFVEGAHRAYRGESSTGYGVFDGVAERIAAETSGARILFSLRNPIDRAWSHHSWLSGLGQERRPFEEAFAGDMGQEADPTRPVVGSGNFRFYHAYGNYGSMLRRYQDVFPSQHIWVIEFSALAHTPETVIADCCAFLELPDHPGIHRVHDNPTSQLDFPRMVRLVEVLADSPGLKRVRKRLPARFKAGAMSRLRRTSRAHAASPMPAATRTWLAEVYASEVAELRRRWPAARTWWVDDFPEPRDAS